VHNSVPRKGLEYLLFGGAAVSLIERELLSVQLAVLFVVGVVFLSALARAELLDKKSE